MSSNKKGKHASSTQKTEAVFAKETKVRDIRKIMKRIGIAFASLLGVFALLYLAGALLFSLRFMPQTTLAGQDVSWKSASDVEPIINQSISDHVVSVSGYGFDLQLDSNQLGLQVDAKQVSTSLLKVTNVWLWPYECFREKDISDSIAVSVGQTSLNPLIEEKVAEHNGNATQPVNAAVAFDSEVGEYVVTPEAVGTALDAAAVSQLVTLSLTHLNSGVELTENELLKPTLLSTDEGLNAQAEAANNLLGVNLTLLQGGSSSYVVDSSVVSTWIVFAEDGTCSISDEMMASWVEQLDLQVSTVGAERTYTRPDGKVITVAGGAYGWNLDTEATLVLIREAVGAKTVGEVEMPFVGIAQQMPAEGKRDWGLRYCDVDLSEQYVRFYDESGALIWEAPCVTGAPDGYRNTPTGVYYVTYKASPCKLRGTNPDGSKYESTVTYWMPFVANTIGLHDANWQAAFGGSRYRNGYGSHGCVNLPPYAAANLYGIIQNGDVVISHW